jgi:hypothetical protein
MHYYMYSIANSSALNGYDINTVVTTGGLSGWQKALIGTAVTFGAISTGMMAVYVTFTVKEWKNKAKGGNEI